MYLYAKLFISGIKESEKNNELRAVAKLLCNEVHPERVKYIIEECGYWRKVNWLHNWFVIHTQKGIDDCKEHFVPHDQIKGLLIDVENALKTGDHSKFTPTEGFFFGSIDPSEQEWKEELEETATILKACLEDYSENWEFYYRSSW